MNQSEGTLIRQLVSDHQPAETSRDENPWLSVLKKEAASWFCDMPLPNRKMALLFDFRQTGILPDIGPKNIDPACGRG